MNKLFEIENKRHNSLGQRRAHPRAAWAGLAAAALAAFLLFRNDLLRAPWGFLDREPDHDPSSVYVWPDEDANDAEDVEFAESESHEEEGG